MLGGTPDDSLLSAANARGEDQVRRLIFDWIKDSDTPLTVRMVLKMEDVARLVSPLAALLSEAEAKASSARRDGERDGLLKAADETFRCARGIEWNSTKNGQPSERDRHAVELYDRISEHLRTLATTVPGGEETAKDWLREQVDAAKANVASWPAWKREGNTSE